jgi:hypothetical protein
MSMRDAKHRKSVIQRSQAARVRRAQTSSHGSVVGKYGNYTSSQDTNFDMLSIKATQTRRSRYVKPSMPKMPWESV